MCAAILPTVKDVTDFRFKKLRDLRVGDEASYQGIYAEGKAIDFLAISNKYGLLFVGTPKGVCVINSKDVDGVNEGDSSARVVADDFPRKDFIQLPNVLHLALSCDDNVLVACAIRSGLVFAHLYDVTALSTNVWPVKPFLEVKMSSDTNAHLVDLKWNPEVVNLFCTCLSDGTVSLYEFEGTNLKISASSNLNARAICWSPKGKQLAVGKSDGSITHYMPNLQMVKTVPAPRGVVQGSEVISVANVLWLSSFQMVVMYIIDDAPFVIIVNAPKADPPTFVNFEDLCYSANEPHKLHYYLSFLTGWGVIICSSSLATDVGVLVFAKAEQRWEQWVMEDSGRAELPLSGNECTYPLGIGVNLNSRREIPVTDTELAPPKPIFHILTSGGLLCSFAIFNDQPEVKNLVKIPETIPQPKQIPQLLREINNSSSQKITTQPTPTSKPAETMPPPMSQGLANVGFQPNFGSSVKFQPSLVPNVVGFPPPASPQSTPQANSGIIRGPQRQPVSSPATAVNSATVPSFVPATSIVKQTPTKPPSANGKKVTKGGGGVATVDQKPSAQTALMKALVEEVTKFDEEVAQVRAKVSRAPIVIGTVEERETLLAKTKSLESFVKLAKDNAKSLNVEIHTLNGCIFDTFSTIEEAKMVHERSQDPDYLRLHKSRQLDPIRAKKMKEIRTLFFYAQNQIQEINSLLDHQHQEAEDLKNKSIASVLRCPKTQLICQTINNHRNVMSTLETRLKLLKEDAEKHRLRIICASKELSAKSNVARGVSLAELAHISNSIKNVSLAPEEQVNKEQKKMRFEALRSALEKRQVSKVRISVTDDDFSRFISPTAKIRNRFASKQPSSLSSSSSLTSSSVEEEEEVSEEVAQLVNQPSVIKKENLEAHRKMEPILFISTKASEKAPELPKMNAPIFGLAKQSFSADNKVPPPVVNPFAPPPPSTQHKFDFSSMKPSFSTPSSKFQTSFLSSTLNPNSNSSPIISSKPDDKEKRPVELSFSTSTPAKFSFEPQPPPPAYSFGAGLRKESEEVGKLVYEDITPPDLEAREESGEEDEEEDGYEEEEDEYYEEEEEEQLAEEAEEVASVINEQEVASFHLKRGVEREQENLLESEVRTGAAIDLSSSSKLNSPTPIIAPLAHVQISSSAQTAPTVKSPAFSFSFATSTAPLTSTTTTSPSSSTSSQPLNLLASVALAAAESPTKSIPTVSPTTFSFLNAATSSASPTTNVPHNFVLPTFSASPTASTSPAQSSPSFFGKFGSSASGISSVFGTATPTTTTAVTPTTMSSSLFQTDQNAVSTPSGGFFDGANKSAFTGLQQTPRSSFSFAANQEATLKAPFGQSSVFHSPQQQKSPTTTSPFGAAPTQGIFGQTTSGSAGGGGGFFSGLGGKPSEANANKNIFGGSSPFGSTTNSSLFGAKPAAPLDTSGEGSFSGSGAFSGGSGDVSQTGFGGFQSSPIKPSGFGGNPQFGSSPTFGGSPAASTFGALGTQVFGSSRTSQNTGFSNFAVASDMPTFGSLATQPASSFSSVMQQPQQQQPPPVFGAPSAASTFGSIASSPPQFGNPSAFGNTEFPSSNPSNFSQWRG